MENVKIAVIGLGPAGLTAIKALHEEGFDVVGFERRNQLGGVWSYSTNLSYTSVLPGTVANVSSFLSGLSDFPVPKEFYPYMTGEQVNEYFQAYARHFQLERHMRFRTTVKQVLRDLSDEGWNVHVVGPDGDAILHFDKVIFSTGSDTVPQWPLMPGKEKFKGSIIHGQSYRKPEKFKGKRVLIVGIGNTACEVSLSLVGHASKIYQSYRRGRVVVSRYFDNGLPSDIVGPWPVVRFHDLLHHKLPSLARPLLDRQMKKQMIHDTARQDPHELYLSERVRRKRAEEKIRQDWRLVPCASTSHVHPVVQEQFVPALSSKHVIPVRGFKAFTGENYVLLDDDSTVEVDAVVFCTGYTLDFSIIPELEMDGAYGVPLATAGGMPTDARESKIPRLPRLYHMIFPPRYASSLAVLSWTSALEAAWCVDELVSMAVAQIWAAETAQRLGLAQRPEHYRRPAVLPSETEMNAEVDRYHAWWRRMWEKEPSVHSGFLRSHTFLRFLHDMAGTGMYDSIGYSLTIRSLRLRWRDQQLYRWLAKGPPNNYAWRVFETNPQGIPGCGRRTWEGARQAMDEAVSVSPLHTV